MIMKILSTIVLLLTAVTLSAQPDAATCTGQTCTGQGSAIGFATVSFFSETDSSAVYGALADSTGRFSVRIPHGNYRMEIALLGYEKKQRGITIAHDTDLGRIVLDPSEISLQGVEVKAAPIVREADRFIVNVADMPQAIGRTAVEMLKLSPGVWIRDDIAIFGKKGAKVMINNRLLRETGEDLINYLNQIPAEDILRIEIVPNSGAEYDADMTAGIIKITLKRKRDNGIDGAVGIYYSHAFSNASSTTSPSFNLNYRNDRLSLYASMGTWFGKQIVRITESSAFEQNDASIRSESRLDGRWKSVSPRIGALYEFNDRHSAGLEVSYFRNLPGGSETHNRLQKQDKADSTRIASLFSAKPTGIRPGDFGELYFQNGYHRFAVQTVAGLLPARQRRSDRLLQPLYRVAGVRHHLPGRHPYGQRPLCGHRRFRNRARSGFETPYRGQVHAEPDEHRYPVRISPRRRLAPDRPAEQPEPVFGKHRGAVRRFFD